VPVGRQSGLASIGAGSQHHLLDLAWRAFLRNHALDVAAMDLFVAPTIGFDLLYVLGSELIKSAAQPRQS
jgi:hypothetical protein